MQSNLSWQNYDIALTTKCKFRRRWRINTKIQSSARPCFWVCSLILTQGLFHCHEGRKRRFWGQLKSQAQKHLHFWCSVAKFKKRKWLPYIRRAYISQPLWKLCSCWGITQTRPTDLLLTFTLESFSFDSAANVNGHWHGSYIQIHLKPRIILLSIKNI